MIVERLEAVHSTWIPPSRLVTSGSAKSYSWYSAVFAGISRYYYGWSWWHFKWKCCSSPLLDRTSPWIPWLRCGTMKRHACGSTCSGEHLWSSRVKPSSCAHTISWPNSADLKPVLTSLIADENPGSSCCCDFGSWFSIAIGTIAFANLLRHYSVVSDRAVASIARMDWMFRWILQGTCIHRQLGWWVSPIHFWSKLFSCNMCKRLELPWQTAF